MTNINLLVIRKALFLATNQNWTKRVQDHFISSEEIVIVYTDGVIVRTTPEIYQTIPRNFSTDWIEITYPSSYVKPYRFPPESRK